MGDIKTPRQAKGSRDLKILQKTSTSVYMGKLPPRSNRNLHHAHALLSSRQVRRIDRQPWEERVANILKVVESHRQERANAMHGAVDRAHQALINTAKKKAEVETFAEEMQAANEEMRAANEEMRANAEEMRAANEELRAVSEELERIHSDQERFVPMAQKHINTPLSQFSEYAENIAVKFQDQLDENEKGHLSFISNQATMMQHLMDHMLAYWNVDIEGKTLLATPCDTLLQQALKACKEMIRSKEAEISSDPLPEALVDKVQFTQLLTVLITNAIQYGPERGAKIHISAASIAQSDIKIPGSEMKLGWIFTIRDNGMGIESQDRERIFHIFETLEKKHSPQRTGMGLAIAWRIVKRHGGQIWTASEPGKGSMFYFTIPEYELPDNETID